MSGHSSNKVIVIAGPTASGKTAISIELAKHFQTAVISCDSRQCYREMLIGTAAPTHKEQQGIRHYFIQSHSIHEPVSAGMYKELAMGWLEEIFKNSNTAIITGGTGLYIQTLLEGIHNFPDTDPGIRAIVKSEFEERGIEHLREIVKSADPEYYEKVDTNNPARLMRAVEIIKGTGKPFSYFLSQQKESNFPYEVRKFVVDIARSSLYERINLRVDAMFEKGLLKEAETLFPYKHLSALSTVGYTELFDYIEGRWSLETAIEKIKQHSRNYAKRQLTWFRNKGDYEFATPEQIIGETLTM